MKDTVLGLREEYEKDAISEKRNKKIIKIVLGMLVVGLLVGGVYYFIYYRNRVQSNYQATSISCTDLSHNPCELVEVSANDVQLIFSAQTFTSSSRFKLLIGDNTYPCEVGSTTSKDFRYFYYQNDTYALLPDGYTSGYQIIRKNLDGTLTVEINYRYIVESTNDPAEWITYTIEFKPVG